MGFPEAGLYASYAAIGASSSWMVIIDYGGMHMSPLALQVRMITRSDAKGERPAKDRQSGEACQRRQK